MSSMGRSEPMVVMPVSGHYLSDQIVVQYILVLMKLLSFSVSSTLSGKYVPDIFSVSVPDSSLPIPSMESNHLHPGKCPAHAPNLHPVGNSCNMQTRLKRCDRKLYFYH